MSLIEWVKLIRRCKAQTVPIRATGTIAELVPYSEHRVTLAIAFRPQNDVRLAWGDPGAAQTGLGVDFPTGTIYLNIWDHGAMVLGPVYGAEFSNAPQDGCYTETLAYLP